jgi:hypothetical protein
MDVGHSRAMQSCTLEDALASIVKTHTPIRPLSVHPLVADFRHNAFALPATMERDFATPCKRLRHSNPNQYEQMERHENHGFGTRFEHGNSFPLMYGRTTIPP